MKMEKTMKKYREKKERWETANKVIRLKSRASEFSEKVKQAV